MMEDEVRSVVLRLLGEIAPEMESERIKPDVNLREQIDLDSMDYLNFIIALSKEFKIEIPEAEYAKLATLNDCVRRFSKASEISTD